MKLKYIYLPIWQEDPAEIGRYHGARIERVLHYSLDGENWTPVETEPAPDQKEMDRRIERTRPK